MNAELLFYPINFLNDRGEIASVQFFIEDAPAFRIQLRRLNENAELGILIGGEGNIPFGIAERHQPTHDDAQVTHLFLNLKARCAYRRTRQSQFRRIQIARREVIGDRRSLRCFHRDDFLCVFHSLY